METLAKRAKRIEAYYEALANCSALRAQGQAPRAIVVQPARTHAGGLFGARPERIVIDDIVPEAE